MTFFYTQAEIEKLEKIAPYTSKQILNVLQLTSEGCTLPFIARYRKEMTDYLDEVQIKHILDEHVAIQHLEKRRNFVLAKVKEKGEQKKGDLSLLQKATSLEEIEIIYSIYKEKTNRKVTEAIDKGLKDFPKKITKLVKESKQSEKPTLSKLVKKVTESNSLLQDTEETLMYAKEIMKEEIVTDAKLINKLQTKYSSSVVIVSKVLDATKDSLNKYTKYYDYKEPMDRIASHRLLALLKGEKDGVLKIKYQADKEQHTNFLLNEVYGDLSNVQDQELITFLENVASDSYTSRLKPKLSRQSFKQAKELSDDVSIQIFQKNLEQMLSKAPRRNKRILCIDPAYRTGCKLAFIDEFGNNLGIDVIYPHAPKNQWDISKDTLEKLITKHKLNHIVVGNGTASKETEKLVRELLSTARSKAFKNIPYEVVNESGASVYSASTVAREEFPTLSVEQRSAISLGRRIQDPLNELVKIPPRSLGLGQYQHLVDEKALTDALHYTVYSVVNRVGVDVNTAGVSLLQYVSGLNPKLSQAIVDYRIQNGPFTERNDLKKVKGMGSHTYEQCVGFLRIFDGPNKFDETGIHPNDYAKVQRLMSEYTIPETLIGTVKMTPFLTPLRERMTVSEFDLIHTLGMSRNTLQEHFREGDTSFNREFDDLEVGHKLKGIVRNVLAFGVFVDIGLKNDAFIHISKLSSKYISDIFNEVNVGEIISCEILTKDEITHKVNMKKLD